MLAVVLCLGRLSECDLLSDLLRQQLIYIKNVARCARRYKEVFSVNIFGTKVAALLVLKSILCLL